MSQCVKAMNYLFSYEWKTMSVKPKIRKSRQFKEQMINAK